RFKRTLLYNRYPKILSALIKNELGEYIHLEWIQTNQYLANEHLPVWKATEYYEKLDTNQQSKFKIMKDVGDFITYHDVEKSSAVVYFEKTGTLHGVIGTKYYIDDLPIELLYKCHKVDNTYVKKRSEHLHNVHKFPKPSSEIIKLFADCNLPSVFLRKFNSLNKLKKQDSCSSTTSDLSSSGTSQTDTIDENYYVETLVFIGHDIMDLLIDLSIDRHFAKHNSPFVQDSFDLIFLMTSRKIEHNGEAIGLTFSGKDIYHMRQRGKTYDPVPISVMKFERDYDNYCSAAHEIGHSFEIKHDPIKSGKRIGGNQCYGMMQQRNPYCLECLKWSKESVEDLKKYMRENRNRCFLLNYPRSLYPNKARKFVTSTRQCQCYGFDSYDLMGGDDVLETPVRDCNSPLLCMKNNHCRTYRKETILPLDGTTCGEKK
ncbi:hypothetical protein PV326_013793, partial [Microctonus aethiopoides]